MNKKSFVITSSVIAALSLTACNTNDTNDTNKPGVTNTGYENVSYRNGQVAPYSATYPANQYPNNYYKNVSYSTNNGYGNGNDHINEGLSSEYVNDGMIKDANARKGNGKYYTNNTLNTPQNVNYNTVPTAPNTNTLVPYTNITTNPNNVNYNGKLSDQISTKVATMSNVANASTIVVGNQVLIAVDLKDNNVDENVARDQIKSNVASLTTGKKVYVTFDPNVQNKVNDFTNKIKNNNVAPNTTQDINNMINNVSNKVQNGVQNIVK